MAIIEVASEGKYALKVISFAGITVYEQLYDHIIDTWVLTKEKFFY